MSAIEMLTLVQGYPPFYAEQPIQIYEKIVAAKVSLSLSLSPSLSLPLLSILVYGPGVLLVLFVFLGLTFQLRFPGHFSKELKDLLKNLLQPDITRRFGNMRGGVSDIKV